MLERRDLLAAVVSDLELVDDTGISDSDLITRDARVTGTASWTSPTTTYLTIEFDHDDNGISEGSVTVTSSSDSFNYDPLLHDSALANWEGPLTLKYRTISHEPGGTVAGGWSDFDMTLDRVAPTVVQFTPQPDATVTTAPSQATVTFDESLDPATVTTTNIYVGDAAGVPLGGQTVAGSGAQAVITFAAALPPGAYNTYAQSVSDVAGNSMTAESSAGWQFLAPPTVTGGIADVTVDEDADDTVISLYDAFDDTEDSDADLTFTIDANTNPGLAATSINPTTGQLTLDYTPDAFGTAQLTIRATDTDGLAVATSFDVTVNSVNDVPVILGFGSVPGLTLRHFYGQVVDEQPAGLPVFFGGVISGTTDVKSDGTFEFLATPTEKGNATARFKDADGTWSEYVYEFVNV